MLLSSEGIGASLQHYNPIVDAEVKETWNIPAEWSLVGQMPFGEPNEQPAERTFLPTEDVVKFIKKYNITRRKLCLKTAFL